MFTPRVRAWTLALLAALVGECPCPAAQPDGDLVPKEALVIPPVGRYGRSAVHMDALEELIVTGKWKAPKAGDQLKGPGGAQTWQAAKFDKNGRLNHAALRGGYAVVTVQSDAERPVVLEASGHGMAYVN